MPIKSYTTNNDPSNHRSLSNLTPYCRLLCACAWIWSIVWWYWVLYLLTILINSTSYQQISKPRPCIVEAKAKAKATKFCPRAVLEVEASPRGPHPWLWVVCLLCRRNEDVSKEDETPATDLTQRHEVTAKTQQFIKQVWPGLSFSSRSYCYTLLKTYMFH